MKTISWITFVFCLTFSSLSFSATEEADHEFLSYHPVSVRAGIGATINPNTLLLMGNAEYNIDRFLGLGLLLQGGTSSNRKLFMPTLGGRFNIPLYFTQRVNLSVQGGVGFVRRSYFGTSFTNFAYEFGTDVDVYVVKNVTVGVGAILNVTSARVERRFGSLYASAAYRF